MESPGWVKARVQKLSAGTIPGLKQIHSSSTCQLCLFNIHRAIDFEYSGGRKEYPNISCSSRLCKALMIKSGVLKSISATHIGITFSGAEYLSSQIIFNTIGSFPVNLFIKIPTHPNNDIISGVQR